MFQSLTAATASSANCNMFPVSTSFTVFTDSLLNLSLKTGNLHATTDSSRCSASVAAIPNPSKMEGNMKTFARE